MAKKNDWIEFLKGLGIFAMVIGGIWLLSVWGNSSANNQAASPDKDSAISKAQNDIDDKYADLLDNAQKMVGDIDTECVWLDDNISTEIGHYCSDNAGANYKEIQTGLDWSSSSANYDETAPLGDIISSIVSEANDHYNALLKTAQETQQAMDDECSWLSSNVSKTVGEDCAGSYSFDASNYSSSPFNESDYYDASKS